MPLPKKRLGQNFLKDKASLQKIVSAIQPEEKDVILEIGPGHGELTSLLLKENPHQVYAIEKDSDLWESLEALQESQKKFILIKGDVRESLFEIVRNIGNKEYKLVGNIPYYLSSHLISQIGNLKNKPGLVVFTVQKEVAERIIEQPSKMNRLSALVGGWAKASTSGIIDRNNFSPVPKVDSAILLLETKKDPVNTEKYQRAVEILFKQPRKNIWNNVKEGLPNLSKEELLKLLEKSFLDPNLRPQNLSTDDISRFGELL